MVLDTGLRIGEALALEWPDVHLTTDGSQWGYVQIREGKSRNARRAVPLTKRAHDMVAKRRKASKVLFVFADKDGNVPRVGSLDHLHAKIRMACKLSPEFVLHSLRHSNLTRLGLAGVEAFTIMKLAGHSSVTVSQRYVHPTPQAMEDAVARLDNMNARSLQSLSMVSAERPRTDSTDSRGQVLVQNVLAPELTPRSGGCPQVIDGRVAQLAEQLTLNRGLNSPRYYFQ